MCLCCARRITPTPLHFRSALGGVIVVCAGAPSPRVLGHLLSFAAGIMLYISYGDLLPHAMAALSTGGDAPGHEGHGHGDASGFFLANTAMLGGMVRHLGGR